MCLPDKKAVLYLLWFFTTLSVEVRARGDGTATWSHGEKAKRVTETLALVSLTAEPGPEATSLWTSLHVRQNNPVSVVS